MHGCCEPTATSHPAWLEEHFGLTRRGIEAECFKMMRQVVAPHQTSVEWSLTAQGRTLNLAMGARQDLGLPFGQDAMLFEKMLAMAREHYRSTGITILMPQDWLHAALELGLEIGTDPGPESLRSRLFRIVGAWGFAGHRGEAGGPSAAGLVLTWFLAARLPDPSKDWVQDARPLDPDASPAGPGIMDRIAAVAVRGHHLVLSRDTLRS